jgi:hypothetical protein
LSGGAGLGLRRATWLTIAGMIAGCAPCAKHDFAALESDWKATLDRSLPAEASPDAVIAFLASHRIRATHFPEDHRVFAFTPLAAADGRVQCRLAPPAALSFDCHFDADAHLLGCTVDAH